jgi:hypothetical protein
VHFGDSVEVLPQVLAKLSGPTLFWLDGHYCAGPSARGDTDTPIAKKLSLVLSRPPGRDIVLIDDARLFTGKDDYPSVDWVRQLVRQQRPTAKVELEGDIICVFPV